MLERFIDLIPAPGVIATLIAELEDEALEAMLRQVGEREAYAAASDLEQLAVGQERPARVKRDLARWHGLWAGLRACFLGGRGYPSLSHPVEGAGS